MKNYLFRTSKRMYFLLLTFFVIVALVGTSAALFITGIVGEKTKQIVKVTSLTYGNAIVTFDETYGNINPEKIDLPEGGSDQTFILKFEIENTGDVKNFITINWKNLVNTFCQYRNNLYECTNINTDTDVRNELIYSLYECTENQYDNATPAFVTGTKISTPADNPVPTSGNTSNIHVGDSITLSAQTTHYFVLKIVLKNIGANQNYQLEKEFNTSVEINNYVAPVTEYAYQNNAYTYLVPTTGTYKIEAWGAEGGNNGGDGAYVSAIYSLTENDLLTINVGGRGTNQSGGYNGGGLGYPSGGGASTVKIGNEYILIAPGGGGGINGTAGGTGNGLGGASVGAGAGTAGLNGGGGGQSKDYDQDCNCEVCVAEDGISTYNCNCEVCTTNGNPGEGGSFAFSASVLGITKIDGAGYIWTTTRGAQTQMPNPKGGLFELGVGKTGDGYLIITIQ